jgi:hypothetical protein
VGQDVVGRLDPGLDCVEARAGVELGDRTLGHPCLELADVRLAVEELPVEVAQLDAVVVEGCDRADAERDEQRQDGRAPAAEAQQGHATGLQHVEVVAGLGVDARVVAEVVDRPREAVRGRVVIEPGVLDQSLAVQVGQPGPDIVARETGMIETHGLDELGHAAGAVGEVHELPQLSERVAELAGEAALGADPEGRLVEAVDRVDGLHPEAGRIVEHRRSLSARSGWGVLQGRGRPEPATAAR